MVGTWPSLVDAGSPQDEQSHEQTQDEQCRPQDPPGLRGRLYESPDKAADRCRQQQAKNKQKDISKHTNNIPHFTGQCQGEIPHLYIGRGERRSPKVFLARDPLDSGPVGRPSARCRSIRKPELRAGLSAKKGGTLLFWRVRPFPYRQGGIGDTDKPVSGSAGPGGLGQKRGIFRAEDPSDEATKLKKIRGLSREQSKMYETP
jgi:hypothetical protein